MIVINKYILDFIYGSFAATLGFMKFNKTTISRQIKK